LAHGQTMAPGPFDVTVVGTDHLRIEAHSADDGDFNLFIQQDEFGMVYRAQGKSVSAVTTASEVDNFGTVVNEDGTGFIWISNMVALHRETVSTMGDIVTTVVDTEGYQTSSVYGQTITSPPWADDEEIDTVVAYECGPDGLRITTSVDASGMGDDGGGAGPTATLLLVPAEWPSDD